MLEDTFGDIIQKARSGQGRGWSRAAVAVKAGLTPVEVGRLEQGDIEPTETQLRSLAKVLGLDGDKLLAIAQGRWRPQPPPATLSELVTVIEGSIGGYGVHAYLLHDRETGDAALIDTAADPDQAIEAVRRAGLSLRQILLTHCHGDHAGGVGTIQRSIPGGAPIHVGASEAGMLSRETSAPVTGLEPDRAAWTTMVGRLTVTALSTPGHTTGGITYLVTDRGRQMVAFVGDALFAGSVGRANHSYSLLLSSIRANILTLDEGVTLLPGHGPATTVGEELSHNPFF